MRFSQFFARTLRENPSEADTVSHQLLVRGGFVHQLVAGVYSYLPLGWRVLRKIEAIIREEMDAAGAQELAMPVLQPVELWEETGRNLAFGEIVFNVKDRKEHMLLLGPTHEEVVTMLARRWVKSYRDLPFTLYQIQTKFRDEPRPRGGLLRVREFPMKDAYSFHADGESLDVTYRRMAQAYKNIFERCGLPTLMVEADSGAIGGKDSHEFMVQAESGEDTIIYCPGGDYAANVEKADSLKEQGETESLLPLEAVATPDVKSIEEVAKFLRVPHKKTLKAVFYSAGDSLVFAVIRGDLDVNEVKLRNLFKGADLRLATDEETRQAGLEPGYASPIGFKGIKIVADPSITLGSNFVAGANKKDAHFRNANYPRDFSVDVMADIAIAKAGEGCGRCGKPLQSTRGIEAGHIFKLETAISGKMGADFLDREGVSRTIIMGCYGIGVGRLLAAAVEYGHDDRGMIWPENIAPFQVHLVGLNLDQPQVSSVADRLYADLKSAGLEVLYDDRAESPGVKFNDADLLGIPVRLTVSPRTIKAGVVEVKRRRDKESTMIAAEALQGHLRELLGKRNGS
ncbi:MAG: proline--tRNA ligase [Chloroflexi bacterium]|nr:proline--tRNA ligase [Chloroflexota bacterium]